MMHSMFETWLAALETRHLADLRVSEVTRALRALSSAYVERRSAMTRGAALSSAGKRAAFALFYAPLHFLAADRIIRELGAHIPPPASVIDLGCGTGAAGAAWAAAAGTTRVTGVDRHPWAVEEARWTYRSFELHGEARVRDITRLPQYGAGTAIIAAYVLNELPEGERMRLERHLLEAGERGARVLILEPIARRLTPWWESTAARFESAGGRADQWRLAVELPPFLRLLDKAAGLDHREITARSLYCPGLRR
jgi:hypothetical protein